MAESLVGTLGDDPYSYCKLMGAPCRKYVGDFTQLFGYPDLSSQCDNSMVSKTVDISLELIKE
jgi:hypothetical protein